ncbi:hypothetical protein NDU88_005439 [Pleurodeles waltl]|uniref:Uncharacterized protein n=1 Tax=Pleurodeles waltl TaxID=8319 RepID=A0AAV7PMN2_PLEWA|nr:hypothetical protein NDU88_005439 [Pleurodeles waltl]
MHVVKIIMRRTAFARELEFWDLLAFRHLAATVDPRPWQEAGCLTIADLHPGETFLTFEAARDTFGLNQGQFLTYATIQHITREIWPTHPEALPSRSCSRRSWNMVGGAHVISHIYKAMIADTPKTVLRARVAWEEDLSEPLGEEQWNAICALLRRGHLLCQI